MFNFAAEAVNLVPLAKGIAMGFGMLGPAIGIGLIGNAFMNAVGRNPEAKSAFGQMLVVIGIVELMALLVFLSVVVFIN
jgi:F0F1-type ATP synthase membrane subunit c/vacuolar-type H+-ATPase subunit K